MGEDDLYDIFPDMDLDGDHDLIDFLILDDIENEIQKEIEESSSHHINVNLDDLDDDDIYIEYGIDREDYATREEYLEAVREARYGWRDEVEVRIELGLDPYDYETEDEYNEAFEEAEEKYGWRTYATGGFDYGISALDFETEDDYYAAVDEAQNAWKSDVEDASEYYLDPEDFETKEEYLEALAEAKYGWRKNAEDGSLYGFTPDAFETAEEYEDALEEAKARIANLGIDITILSAFTSENCESGNEIKANYSYIQIRKNNAKIELKRAEKGEFYGSEDELDRCKFIATSKCIAARYLTVDGVYLYAQAVKDHFKLPFEIADEKEEIETHFETLLQDLVEDNAEYAMEIWEWCMDTFMPYIQYADYKNDLTHAILLDINNFIDEFPSIIIDYMVNKPEFIEKLIYGCTDSLWGIEDFVLIALKGNHIKTATDIMRFAFANPHTDVRDKARIISSCIDECSNWDELETMELFREHIFPITFNETDVRIKNKIPRWQNAMTEYIESMERECDKYAYTRVNSWRAKYRNADINPIHYDSEDDYQETVAERKYGWRKYCTNKFAIDPNSFETRAEYDLAITAEYEKERRTREQERVANAKDSRLYSFCKVSINYPDKPHYYYLTGSEKLHVGDTVIVPFGSDNAEIRATVVAVGECMGANFPCTINRIKQVKEKVE